MRGPDFAAHANIKLVGLLRRWGAHGLGLKARQGLQPLPRAIARGRGTHFQQHIVAGTSRRAPVLRVAQCLAEVLVRALGGGKGEGCDGWKATVTLWGRARPFVYLSLFKQRYLKLDKLHTRLRC